MPGRDFQQWLAPRLERAAALMNDDTPIRADGPLYLGIDLGTSDIVSMVLDADDNPVAVCLDWADVVRDGIVWDYFGAVSLVRSQMSRLQNRLGRRIDEANTSFPPGTDQRISVNVIEAAGLRVAQVIDEPSAVAALLGIGHNAKWW